MAESKALLRFKCQVCMKLTTIELALPQSRLQQTLRLLQSECERSKTPIHQRHPTPTIMQEGIKNFALFRDLQVFIPPEGQFVRFVLRDTWRKLISLIDLILVR